MTPYLARSDLRVRSSDTGSIKRNHYVPGWVAQSVTCLSTDASLQIQGSRVQSWPGPILSWSLIMK